MLITASEFVMSLDRYPAKTIKNLLNRIVMNNMRLSFLLLCLIITLQVSAQLRPFKQAPIKITPVLNTSVSPQVIHAYNWWIYINPTNVNYFGTFINVNPINADTGVLNFPKKTAISLVGWINPNVNLGIAISDDSLIHLEPLMYLEQLLINSRIGDRGIMHLRMLNNLRHFEVAVSGSPANNISDKSMEILGALERMEILRLYFCNNVTDYGLEKLTGLSNLQELGLNGCGITDRGLKFLSAFPKLQTLSLAATGITDEGIDILIQLLPSLPFLNKIIISHSPVTVNGKQRLIDSRSGLTVIY